ncbi:hypothetical protein AGLY_012012 [Aphis glycines]|uniref:Uncharacterized protein n=1 Tax=Aphis glycines TaxID=307491 RepID=A0A6G0TCD5_APHGL|nr:hypothetical protein AGLY_012012 [Aphis glycines]
MPFSGVITIVLLLNLIGMSVFSHGSTSYLVKSSVNANFISISANRFPKINSSSISPLCLIFVAFISSRTLSCIGFFNASSYKQKLIAVDTVSKPAANRINALATISVSKNRLHEVVPDQAVLLPVPHRVGKRVCEELDGVLREESKRRLEHGLAVPAERGLIVADGVQLQSERARADHVGGILSERVAHFYRPTRGRHVRGHVAHQLLAAGGYLASHVPQLAGREHGTELLPHHLPLGARHVEQTVGQRVLVRPGRVQPVVGKVCKVADQHAVHQRRVAHQQMRRAHLVHADVPVTAKRVVDPAEHASLVFGAQRHAGYVAEQRHRGPHVRHAPVAPVAERGRGPVERNGCERHQQSGRPPAGRQLEK